MIAEAFSSMNAWVPLLTQGTACVAAGLAGSYILRNRPARAHQVLVVAMLASVIAPGLYLLAGHLGLGLLVPQTTVPAMQEAAEAWTPAALEVADLPGVQAQYDPVGPDAPQPAPAQVADQAVATGLPWRTLLVLCWIASSVALLARLLLRFILGLRLLRSATALEGESLCTAAEVARTKLGIRELIEVRGSDRIQSPIIWCWSRRPVLLVQGDPEPDKDRTDWVAVFCHELAHWKRIDHVSGLWAELLTAALPWHPLMRWAKLRMHLLSEQACDDWVLASGQVGVDYAESLLNLSPERQMAFVPTVVGKEKAMRQRIRRIVTDRCGDPRIGTRWALAVSLLAALAIVGVAVAQPRPAEPPVPEGVAQPGPREQQERLDPPLVGRRNVLSRLRDQLLEQVRDTETALRGCPDPEGDQAQTLRSELETLREQIQLVERQLGDLGRGLVRNRPEARRESPMPPELQRRAAALKQAHQELSEKLRAFNRRLEGLGEGRDPEARELRDRIDQIAEQIRDVERQMADLQRERADMQRARPVAAPDRADADWPRVERTPGEGRNPEGRLRDLREREQQARGRLQEVGDRDREAAAPLEQELDRTHEEIAAIERKMQANESAELVGTAPRMQQVPGDMITTVYKLRYASADQMWKVILPLLSRSGHVAVDTRTDSMVVTDTQEIHRRIQGIIKELDVQGSGGRRNGTEVDELRTQVKGLQEQMQQMRALLEQLAAQKAKTSANVEQGR